MKSVFKWIGIIVAAFFVLVIILAIINPKSKDSNKSDSTAMADVTIDKNALPNPIEFMKKWNALNEQYSTLPRYSDDVIWLPTPSKSNDITVDMNDFKIHRIINNENQESFILQANFEGKFSDLKYLNFMQGAARFTEVFWPNTSPEQKRALFEELGALSTTPPKDMKTATRGNIEFGYSSPAFAIFANTINKK